MKRRDEKDNQNWTKISEIIHITLIIIESKTNFWINMLSMYKNSII